MIYASRRRAFEELPAVVQQKGGAANRHQPTAVVQHVGHRKAVFTPIINKFIIAGKRWWYMGGGTKLV
jgi:hypothetical protein